MTERIVRKWWKRFEQQGLTGLEDAPRPGAPARYTVENKARVLEAALTRPTDLGLAFNCWTFERLAAYVHEHLGIQMKKTRIFEILHKEGLRWRQQETWFGERLDPDFAKKGGHRAAGFTAVFVFALRLLALRFDWRAPRPWHTTGKRSVFG